MLENDTYYYDCKDNSGGVECQNLKEIVIG